MFDVEAVRDVELNLAEFVGDVRRDDCEVIVQVWKFVFNKFDLW